jgi:uncharacterized integral membrane protein
VPNKSSKKSDRIESPTRTAHVNLSIVAGLIVLLLVVIFVAQNSSSVSIKFLGWNGHMSLGLALLVAAIAGGLIVALFGMARIIQLRHRARKASSVPVSPEADPVIDMRGPESAQSATPPVDEHQLGDRTNPIL